MIKYTPSKQILKDIAHARKKHYMGYFMYEDACKILKNFHVNDYTSRTVFHSGSFEKTVFYSKTKRKFIPVGSAMLPVSMFQATITEND